MLMTEVKMAQMQMNTFSFVIAFSMLKICEKTRFFDTVWSNKSFAITTKHMQPHVCILVCMYTNVYVWDLIAQWFSFILRSRNYSRNSFYWPHFQDRFHIHAQEFVFNNIFFISMYLNLNPFRLQNGDIHSSSPPRTSVQNH